MNRVLKHRSFSLTARLGRAALALLPTLLVGSVASAQTIGGGGPSSRLGPMNHPPVITTNLAQGAVVRRAQDLRFEIRVSDPNGDAVTLKLLNPPPGLVFHPVTEGGSPATREVRWLVCSAPGGIQELVFEAHDEVSPAVRARLSLRLRVIGPANTATLEGDVTGDGVPDTVAGASEADVGGVQDTGAIYVFAGGAGLSGSVSPRATLSVPGALSGDRLGHVASGGQGIQLADVTGDGVMDVVAGAILADVGATDTGAIYVFAGGPGLSGSVSPTATLSVPGATHGDRLGYTSSGQGTQLADMTGDGVLDVVAGASWADVDGYNAGAVYVFAGGAALTGSVSPHATLAVPDAQPSDKLGHASLQGINLADVSGDGLLDAVVGARSADVDGIEDVGAVYVFAGGADLIGSVSPRATLAVPGAAAYDYLGFTSGYGIQLADVSDDGVLDVVAGTLFADREGVRDAGAVYVFAGGAGLSGSVVPSATLAVPGAVFDDRLGESVGQGIQLADVSGDGVPDVVAGAMMADVGGSLDNGAVYVFNGGAGLSGSVSPSATLFVPGAVSDDRLGYVSGWGGIQLADVNGDGELDIVAGAILADVAGVIDAGAVYVFAGGTGLSGSVPPSASLSVPGAGHRLRLGRVEDSGQGIQLADVSGDGLLDVVAGATSGGYGAGGIFVFAGGGGLSGAVSPRATLFVPGSPTLGPLGYARWSQGIQLADVSGDGVLDVVAAATVADMAGVYDVGAIHVFAGGSGLSGAVPPRATLSVPGAATGAQLGFAEGQGIQLADMDGNGVLDIVAGARFADVNGISDSGAVYVFAGGAELAGSVPPGASLSVPGSRAGDELGSASGQGIFLRDVNGDGRLDVVAGAPSADIDGVPDTGAVYVWSGPLIPRSPASTAMEYARLQSLESPPSRPATLTVPGAVPGDRLGS